MAQIINEYRGLGDVLGQSIGQGLSGLGEGFGSSLQHLANLKLNELTQRQQAKHLQGLHPKLTQEQLMGVLNLPQKAIPSVLAEIINELNQSGNPEAATQFPNQLPQQEPTGMQNLASLLTGQNVNPLFRQALSQTSMPPGSTPNQAQQVGAQMGQQEQPVQPQPAKSNNGSALIRGLRGSANKGSAQDIQEQRRIDAEQKTLRPFLDKEQVKYDTEQELGDLADEALEILREHHKDFPGAFKGNLSQKQLALLERNPNVRRYNSILNRIVILSGQQGKGLPSKHRLTLEALAKTDLNQPLKTQERNLEAIQEHRDRSTERWNYILSQNKEGNYPKDIQSRVVQYDMHNRNPLQYPQFFDEGTEYLDKNGRHKVVNGKWVKV